MKIARQKQHEMQEVGDLVEGIRAAILSTLDGEGRIVSRPMGPMEMDDAGAIWFFTSAKSAKTHQLAKLNLTFADVDKSVFVSMTGSGSMSHDRKRIEALWSPMAKPWFPEGVSDPDLALLKVDIDTAEIWESSSNALVRLVKFAAAVVTGNPALVGEHKLVTNPG